MIGHLTKQYLAEKFTILFILMVIIACSSRSSDLLTDFSGKWQTEKGTEKVDIELSKEASSLSIAGKNFNGTVDKIDDGSNTVYLKVETAGGHSEVWSLHQEWNDNGSFFKLKLKRNGTIETLIPVGRS